MNGRVDRDALPDDWASGADTHDLAAKYGCSASAVRAAARALDLPARKPGRKPKPVEDDALTGGRWVTGPDRIARWVPDR